MLKSLNIKILSAILVAGALGLPQAAPAMTADEVLNYKGPDRQKLLEDGARKEGQMTIYSSLTINQALRPMVEAFRKKYPYIKSEFWRGDTRKIAQKVMAEIRSKALQVDVLESSGLAEIMVQAKLVAKFSSPVFDRIPAAFRDKDGLLVPSRFSFMGMAYNTKLIPPGSQPKTLEDLLDPKWKGKIAWRANSESGDLLFISSVLRIMGDQKGEAYLKKLSGQKIVNFDGSARTLVNRVIEGEYPVALNIFLHHPIISARKGAPVAAYPMEPVTSISGSLMIPKGVKHPHAAMLFIEYYLSAEGQKVLQKAKYFPVMPDVAPHKDIKDVSPRVTGVKESYFDPETLFSYRKKSLAIVNKHFR